MQKYLGLTQEEMKENEEYWKEENKYNESEVSETWETLA